MTRPQRATTYYLKSVVIDSPRFAKDEPTGNTAIDVTAICPEINLYESLYTPYITGEIMLVDTGGISNLIKASGQETVTIDLYVNEDYPLKREFILYSVKKQIKGINSSSSTYVYSIIEKHGFFSYFQRLNKAYTGNISDIIYGIYKSDLYGLTDSDTGNKSSEDFEKTILNFENFERSDQTIKIISPNKTPLGLCMWLAKRATSEYGEPFFLYSSLREGPQFRSLGGLMLGDIQNVQKPYRYSQVYTNTDFGDEIYRIFDIGIPENDNSIALAKAGAFGVLYQSIDPFFKSNDRAIYQAKFDQNKYFDIKREAGRTKQQFNIYDDSFLVGPNNDQTLSSLNSQIHSQINTSFSFEDFNGYDEEPNISKHIYKMRRSSDMAFLQKQKMTVIIPGYNMLKDEVNTSIGKLIDITIPSDLTHTVTPSDENLYDTKKGSGVLKGIYLTTKVRHRFGFDSNYVASLEVTKMDSSESLD